MRRKQTPKISIALLAALMVVMVALPSTCSASTPYLVVTSCDKYSNEIDEFAPGEGVYVKGVRFWPNTDYTLWIQPDPVKPFWVNWTELNASEDPSGEQELITTDGEGTFGPTLIWSIPVDAPVTYDAWDIIVDKEGLGEGWYNLGLDGLDALFCAGILAPTPDVSALVLFASGLGLVSLYFVHERRKEERTQISRSLYLRCFLNAPLRIFKRVPKLGHCIDKFLHVIEPLPPSLCDLIVTHRNRKSNK